MFSPYWLLVLLSLCGPWPHPSASALAPSCARWPSPHLSSWGSVWRAARAGATRMDPVGRAAAPASSRSACSLCPQNARCAAGKKWIVKTANASNKYLYLFNYTLNLVTFDYYAEAMGWEACPGLLRMLTAGNQAPDPLINVTRCDDEITCHHCNYLL